MMNSSPVIDFLPTIPQTAQVLMIHLVRTSSCHQTYWPGRGGRHVIMSSDLLFWQRRPSGKQSLPVPSSGSLPQSLGNISSCPVACGDSVPSSVNWKERRRVSQWYRPPYCTLCPWSCPMIMCITPCMKGWNTFVLKFWIGWTNGWKAWPNPNPTMTKLLVTDTDTTSFPH